MGSGFQCSSILLCYCVSSTVRTPALTPRTSSNRASSSVACAETGDDTVAPEVGSRRPHSQVVGELGLGFSDAHCCTLYIPALPCPVLGLEDHPAAMDTGCLILLLNLINWLPFLNLFGTFGWYQLPTQEDKIEGPKQGLGSIKPLRKPGLPPG